MRSLLSVLVLLAGSSLAAAPQGRYVLPERAAWQGEVVEIALEWRVDRAGFRALDGELAWDAAPLLADPWKPATLRDDLTTGVSTITYRRSMMAPTAGRQSIPPAALGVLMKVGDVTNDDYTRAVLQSVTLRSERGTLRVRPLPIAPPGFGGAVGRFVLEARLDRASVRVGEPVKWTLVLRGRGNWPMIAGMPARPLPASFVLRERESKNVGGGSLFEGERVETLTLLPQKPGRYTLPQTTLPVFDPALGRYVTLRTRAASVLVTGVAATNGTSDETAGTGDATSLQLLEGVRVAAAPLPLSWSRRVLQAGIVGSLALLALLVLIQAWRSDPHRPARVAHRRIRRALDRLQRATNKENVREWQDAVAARFGVRTAAPTVSAVAGLAPWELLWRESDAYLYGPDAPLAKEWISRALQASSTLESPPRFDIRVMGTARAWLPRRLAATLFVVTTVTMLPSPLSAQSASETWTARLESAPLDVVLRYNLAVALAAEGNVSAAAIQAAVVQLHDPSFKPSSSLTMRLRQQAGLVSEDEGGLPEFNGITGRVVQLLPLTIWQRAALALQIAVLMLGSALLVVLYLAPARRRRVWLVSLLVVATALAAIPSAIVLRFAPLLEANAIVIDETVLLRRLPVENLLDEGPRVLPGAVGRVEGHFLGWARVRLVDGREGWVRNTAALPLWPPQ